MFYKEAQSTEIHTSPIRRTIQNANVKNAFVNTHSIDWFSLVSADANPDKTADHNALEVWHETPSLEPMSRQSYRGQLLFRLYLLRFLLLVFIFLTIRLRLGFGRWRRRRRRRWLPAAGRAYIMVWLSFFLVFLLGNTIFRIIVWKHIVRSQATTLLFFLFLLLFPHLLILLLLLQLSCIKHQ